MARLRAVVMIHPAGLGGRPSRGQRRTAAVNASWTASSARSMSPKRRTRTATARPCSRRNTPSMSCRAGIVIGPPSALRLVLERAHLDAQRRCHRQLASPGEGGIEILGPDDRQAADLLLALGKGSVGHQDLVALGPQDGGRAGVVEAA